MPKSIHGTTLAGLPLERWQTFSNISDDVTQDLEKIARSSFNKNEVTDFFISEKKTITLDFSDGKNRYFNDIVVLGKLTIQSSIEDEKLRPTLHARHIFTINQSTSTKNVFVQPKSWNIYSKVDDFKSELTTLLKENRVSNKKSKQKS
ncbi:MAG: hypothetical protein L0207_04890 [Chlamydiae bacterium]|nr:hypothetical protein [Chlamydiota bacterium]